MPLHYVKTVMMILGQRIAWRTVIPVLRLHILISAEITEGRKLVQMLILNCFLSSALRQVTMSASLEIMISGFSLTACSIANVSLLVKQYNWLISIN